MTNEELKKLQKFEAHFHLLMENYTQLTVENQALNTTLAQKEEEIMDLQQKLQESKNAYDNLKLAKMISISDNELENAKKRLSKLVRDVDKCIALLKT